MVTSSISCDRCRKRKVKCDRAVPCSNCQRHNVVCHISPTGMKPKRQQGGNQNKETIQARLARLESLLEDLSQAESHLQVPTPEINHEDQHVEGQQNVATGDRLHRYIAGPVWSQLSAQIEGLRDILLANSDDEDAMLPTTFSPPQQQASPCDILLYSNSEILVVNPESLQHPPPAIRQQLFSIYCENFDPLIKIIHRPTIHSQLQKIEAIPQDDVEEAEIHALLFAIYAAAVMTLTDESYSVVANETRSDALRRFTFAIEYFLSKSRYVESRSIVPLQAFTIYLLVIRAQNASQRAWALTALAVQLARGLGLHSEKTTNNFKPLQRESRSRLWFALHIIEFRAALDRGMDPIIKLDGYDTPFPTNLNDDDLTDDMVVTPMPRQGLTDVHFSLIPYEGLGLMIKLQSIDLSSPACDSGDIWTSRLRLVDEYETGMEDRFCQYCDDRIPIQWLTRYVVTVISELCRLLALRPMSRLNEQSVPPPPQTSQQILDRALQSLRTEELLFHIPVAKGFHWYRWVQWYVLAVALVEMCATPETCRDDEVWSVVQLAYGRQSWQVADTADGALWQPMKKLMGKVESLRQAMVQPFRPSLPLATRPDCIDHTFPSNEVLATSYLSSQQDATYQLSNQQLNVGPVPDDSIMQTGPNDSFFHWDQFVGDMTSFEPTSDWFWNM